MSTLPSLRKNLGVVLLTLFLDLVGFSIIFPLFPGMLDYYFEASGQSGILGWAVSRLDGLTGGGHYTAVLFGGILGSLYSGAQFIFAPTWGRRSDRIGRKPVLRLTLLGTTVSYLIWVLSGCFELLLLGRLLGGIMAGNISVATAAVADITSKQNRARGMALVGAVFGLGFIVGPVMGAALSKINFLELAPGLARIGINPFSAPALLALILSLINLIWFQLRFKESLTEKYRNQSRSAGAWTSLVALIRVDHPGIRQVNGLFLIFIAAFSGMEFTLTFLAVERFQYSPAQNGFIFLYVGFFMVLIQGALVGRLTAKLGEKRLALYGLGFGVMALLLLSHSNTIPLFYASLTLLAVAGGLVNPSLASLVSLYSTEENQGVNLGLFRSSGSFARAVGPLLAAAVYWYFGAKAAYLLAGIIVIVPLYRCFFLPPVGDKGPD